MNNILGKVIAPMSTALLLVLSLSANASQITSGTNIYNGIGNFYGTPFDIGNVSDRSGLSVSFTSGTTDFNTYISGNPTHTWIDLDKEWHTTFNPLSSNNYLIFDIGANYLVDKLALWNEDVIGITKFSVSTSLDNSFYLPVSTGTGLTPNNNPYDPAAPLDYIAEVFNLTTSIGRYIKISIIENGKYTYINGSGNSVILDGFVTMGEIAFSTTPVPEPATILLLGAGLLGLTGLRKKKK